MQMRVPFNSDNHWPSPLFIDTFKQFGIVLGPGKSGNDFDLTLPTSADSNIRAFAIIDKKNEDEVLKNEYHIYYGENQIFSSSLLDPRGEQIERCTDYGYKPKLFWNKVNQAVQDQESQKPLTFKKYQKALNRAKEDVLEDGGYIITNEPDIHENYKDALIKLDIDEASIKQLEKENLISDWEKLYKTCVNSELFENKKTVAYGPMFYQKVKWTPDVLALCLLSGESKAIDYFIHQAQGKKYQFGIRYSELYLAMLSGSGEAVEKLLADSPSKAWNRCIYPHFIRAQDYPIYLAAMLGHLDVLKVLEKYIRIGAKNSLLRIEEGENYNLLDFAIRSGSVEMVRYVRQMRSGDKDNHLIYDIADEKGYLHPTKYYHWLEHLNQTDAVKKQIRKELELHVQDVVKDQGLTFNGCSYSRPKKTS